jgi:hypothetical protein
VAKNATTIGLLLGKEIMMNYDKLTKKELICTLIARDEMLKNCRERFELHKTTDANTIQEQSDLIDVLNKALELSREYMFNVMCADDVPSIEWFIKKAKEMPKSE